MFDYLSYKINKKRLRTHYQKKKGPYIYVANPSAFFDKLESNSISYVHLPLLNSFYGGKEECRILLVNSTDIRKVLSCGSKLKKGIRLYLYSSHGGNKTNFGAYTLFPPSFSLRMLSVRDREDDCFVPCVEDQILSYLYFLAYHEIENDEGQLYLTMDALSLLEDKKKGEFATNLKEITPFIKGKNVFKALCLYHWDVPYDLYVNMEARGKFPRSISPFIDLPEMCQVNAKKYPAMFTYTIREDVARFGYLDFCLEKLEEKFDILYSKKLTIQEVYNTYSFTRGGVWTKRNKECGRLEDGPFWIVVGNDSNLITPEEGSCIKKHSILDNKNLLFKEELRHQINDRASYTVSGIHGNDNAVEAQYILYRVFAEKYSKMVEYFATRITADS